MHGCLINSVAHILHNILPKTWGTATTRKNIMKHYRRHTKNLHLTLLRQLQVIGLFLMVLLLHPPFVHAGQFTVVDVLDGDMITVSGHRGYRQIGGD